MFERAVNIKVVLSEIYIYFGSLEYDYVVHENELFGLIYKSTGRINHILNGWFFKTHVSYPLILHVSKIKES